MIADLISGIFKPVTNIVDKMVMDKDKYAELQFKKIELEHQARSQLLAITTTPTIDAWVKLLLAFRDVIIPMFRPVGSFALAAFAAYCTTENIPLPEFVQAALYGSPLAWGASRHVNKQTKAKAKKEEEEDFSWAED